MLDWASVSLWTSWIVRGSITQSWCTVRCWRVWRRRDSVLTIGNDSEVSHWRVGNLETGAVELSPSVGLDWRGILSVQLFRRSLLVDLKPLSLEWASAQAVDGSLDLLWVGELDVGEDVLITAVAVGWSDVNVDADNLAEFLAQLTDSVLVGVLAEVATEDGISVNGVILDLGLRSLASKAWSSGRLSAGTVSVVLNDSPLVGILSQSHRVATTLIVLKNDQEAGSGESCGGCSDVDIGNPLESAERSKKLASLILGNNGSVLVRDVVLPVRLGPLNAGSTTTDDQFLGPLHGSLGVLAASILDKSLWHTLLVTLDLDVADTIWLEKLINLRLYVAVVALGRKVSDEETLLSGIKLLGVVVVHLNTGRDATWSADTWIGNSWGLQLSWSRWDGRNWSSRAPVLHHHGIGGRGVASGKSTAEEVILGWRLRSRRGREAAATTTQCQ